MFIVCTFLPKQIPCLCKLSWPINPFLILINFWPEKVGPIWQRTDPPDWTGHIWCCVDVEGWLCRDKNVKRWCRSTQHPPLCPPVRNPQWCSGTFLNLVSFQHPHLPNVSLSDILNTHTHTTCIPHTHTPHIYHKHKCFILNPLWLYCEMNL